MRTKLFLAVLFIAVVGFSACKKKKDSKSSACDIVSFTVDGVSWCDGNCAATITKQFPKGSQVGSLTPTIKVSDKASVSPESGISQDFSSGRIVKYTVTAENGDEKVYSVSATVATQ
ncbi:MAG: hypothetical protein LBQ60_21205 [Bacteroidales bacterium]|jgi:altronate dehydratase|nr:hypothetical protein [Bacteroidales bacterium]